MNTELMKLEISTNFLQFEPGKQPVSFEVSAINLSNKFASFQVSLKTPRPDQNHRHDWYKLAPDISQKTPAGGTAKFCVTIFKNPVKGFTGLLDLRVKLLSIELGDIQEIIKLDIKPGLDESSLQVKLPVKKFKRSPGETFKIPWEIKQDGINSVNILATLKGFEPTWLIEGTTQKFLLPGKGGKEQVFTGQLPSDNTVISKVYPFTIKVELKQGQPVEIQGSLEVLHQGKVIFENTLKLQQLPKKLPSLPRWKTSVMNYHLKFNNQSNLKQFIGVSLLQSDIFPLKLLVFAMLLPKWDAPIISRLFLKIFVKLWKKDTRVATLFLTNNQFVKVNPNETKELDLKIQTVSPWFGKIKTLSFAVSARASDKRINVENRTQFLPLKIYPKIPLWLGGVTGLLLLCLWYWLSCLNPYSPVCGHQQPINSVQFNGRGINAISGSDDQKIIEWNLDGFGWKKLFTNPILDQLIYRGKESDTSPKSVRVVRYKPLENNVLAAGLENGEIQVWDLLDKPSCPQARLIQNAANRVLDLAFSQDSQFLYGSYGNGEIKQWQLNPNPNNSPNNSSNCNPITTTPKREQKFNFAIYSLLFVGMNRDLMVLGGQYNKLCLTNSNLTNKSCDNIGQTTGNDQDYIHSITKAQDKPTNIVTADNRGRIQVWDLSENNCLDQPQKCKDIAPRDQWRENPSNVSPVYSVALSEQGCYLVSGGENGEVLLWVMNANGSRARAEPIKIYTSPQPINSVDIKVINEKIYILSGGDRTKVRLNVYTFKKLPTLGCNN